MSDPRRFLALAEGQFGPMSSKTANACIRYLPECVAAVIDSTKAGSTAQDVLGFGGPIPIVASLEEGLRHAPTALLIGIAPQGGRLPDAWRAVVVGALQAGLDVWSGLHHFLGDDPELARLAQAHGAAIRDFRRPPVDLPIAAGRTRSLAASIVLTVGSDCNIGKMTTQLQLRDALVARGRRAAFAPTGQTGILLEGRGIPVDAVVADFIAGAAERLTMEAAEGADIVLVEGQGSLVHPGYSGVTYGLIHGCVPHAFILCTQPSRKAIRNNEWVRIPSLTELIRLHETVAAPLRPARVIGIALNTHDLSDADARGAIEAAHRETGLPVTDAVRYDPSPLTDAITGFHDARISAVAAAA